MLQVSTCGQVLAAGSFPSALKQWKSVICIKGQNSINIRSPPTKIQVKKNIESKMAKGLQGVSVSCWIQTHVAQLTLTSLK